MRGVTAVAFALGVLPAIMAVGPLAVESAAEATSVETTLTEQQFWGIIDRSAASRGTPEDQLANLRRSLESLKLPQIVDFERRFGAAMARSNTWDLWGAAYLANGGASDDGFEYFRYWLISQGKTTFERVVASPDSLAEVLPLNETASLEFEEFGYVAREVWAEKTGRDPAEMPLLRTSEAGAPSGKPWRETESELKQRYPKLSVYAHGR